MGKCYMDQNNGESGEFIHWNFNILRLKSQKLQLPTTLEQKVYRFVSRNTISSSRKEGLKNFLKCNRCYLTCVLNIVTLLLYYEIYIGSACKVQN